MKKFNYRTIRFIKRCFNEISFKDKGLILIMIVLLLQCIHNLYNPNPTQIDYLTVNIAVRTSIAGIFGYFLSSNFMSKSINKNVEDGEYNLEVLEKILKDEELRKEVESKYESVDKEKEIRALRKEKDQYICNSTLQNGVAITICLIITIALIVGVNFNLIAEGSSTTISQLRDLISASIGFLTGNSDGNKKKQL